MSFICEGCGSPQPNGARPRKVLVAVRVRPSVVYVRERQGRGFIKFRDGKECQGAVCGGEPLLCTSCASKAASLRPQVVEHSPNPVSHYLDHDPRRTNRDSGLLYV